MAVMTRNLKPALLGVWLRSALPPLLSQGRPSCACAALAAVLLVAGCSGPKGTVAAAAGRHDQGIALTPDPPNVRTQLAVVLDLPDIDPARCTYVWQRNGGVIAEATTSELAPHLFHKNDRVSVEVGVPGRNGAAPLKLTAETRVADSAPLVMAVQLALDNSGTTPRLRAHPDCQDPDGDEVTYQFRWFRNDSPIENASDSVLTLGSFTPSDRITVEVVARAGRMVSEPARSEAFAFDNRPPQFTAPPTALTPGQSVLRYQAVASDPDGDALKYELVEAPPGMTIDGAGAMQWTMAAGDQRRGEYNVKLRVSDGKGGEATQGFVIRMGTSGQ